MKTTMVNEIVYRQTLQFELQKAQCEMDKLKESMNKTKKAKRSRRKAMNESSVCGTLFSSSLMS